MYIHACRWCCWDSHVDYAPNSYIGSFFYFCSSIWPYMYICTYMYVCSVCIFLQCVQIYSWIYSCSTVMISQQHTYYYCLSSALHKGRADPACPTTAGPKFHFLKKLLMTMNMHCTVELCLDRPLLKFARGIVAVQWAPTLCTVLIQCAHGAGVVRVPYRYSTGEVLVQ